MTHCNYPLSGTTGKMKVLVIAPHPDDETLGCGGTILKHKAAGDEVYWLIMTNIFTDEDYSEAAVRQRQEEIVAVSKEYAFEEVFKLDFPTTKLDEISRSRMIEAVSGVIHKVKPDIVYLPHRSDAHSDHKITFDVTISSTKTFRCPFIKKMFVCEVISETEFAPSFQSNAFVPNSFSDISDFLEQKINIMKIYKGEMEVHPFPRSEKNIRALAAFRGAVAGVNSAEAFMMIKDIW